MANRDTASTAGARFYRVCCLAHPMYYWSEPNPYPTNELALLRSKRRPRQPPKYVVKTGRFPCDVVAFGVWSKRMVANLRACRASGWGCYPAHVERRGTLMEDYFALRVTGLGGPFDARRSHAVMFDDGSVFGYKGIYVDESKWDGSDVFTIPGLGLSIFVTQRVAEALMSVRLKNVTLVKSTEC